MDFPFKSRKKPIELKDPAQTPDKKTTPKAPDIAPGENLGGMFRGRKRKAALAALTHKYENIQRIKDPALQLLQYKDLQKDCEQLSEQMTGKSWLGGAAVALGGVAMGAAAVATVNPFLLMGGLFAAGAGVGMIGKGPSQKKWTLSGSLAKDSEKLFNLYKSTQNAIDNIVMQVPLLKIAQSPFFDEATVSFPALKDRFLTAAAKDKMLQDARNPQPKKDDGKPGFKS